MHEAQNEIPLISEQASRNRFLLRHQVPGKVTREENTIIINK